MLMGSRAVLSLSSRLRTGIVLRRAFRIRTLFLFDIIENIKKMGCCQGITNGSELSNNREAM